MRVWTAAILLLALTVPSAGQGGNSCTISTQTLAFGSYDPYNASPVDGQGTIQYGCLGLVRSIRISISPGSMGSFDRAMTGQGGRLYYNLYQEAPHQTIWGNGSGGSQPLVNANVKSNIVYVATIYGRIPPLQSVDLGDYSDSLVVTADF